MRRAYLCSSCLGVVLVVGLLGGCMNVQKVHQPPETLQENIRQGELIRPGDSIAVVTSSLGERVFVVTAVDEETIRGEGVEVPIDEVVALETRKIAPVRTGLAIYGGINAALFAIGGLLLLTSLRF